VYPALAEGAAQHAFGCLRAVGVLVARTKTGGARRPAGGCFVIAASGLNLTW
jgi:hypothetical protein